MNILRPVPTLAIGGLRHILLCLAAALFAACTDNTQSLGLQLDSEKIASSDTIFGITTYSTLLDSVIANSTTCYLGSITDPETTPKITITAEFAAQFATLEDYDLPQNVVFDTNGRVKCDAAEVRLYFEKYYGSGTNPMKLEVYKMSQDNMLNEDSTYYTDVDLNQFLPAQAKPLATRVFTPIDYNVSSSDLSSSDHSHNINVALPTELGQDILQYCYEHGGIPNSFHFTHKVLPGLLFRTTSGEGTMINVYVGTLNLFFSYHGTGSAGQDTIYSAMARFSATPEVIQTTHFDNGGSSQLKSLIDNNPDCTFLKTPAGICTEMQLPIDELFSGKHRSDSISLATITLTRINNQQDNAQHFSTAQSMLMVRKADRHKFFAQNRVSDNRTSYTTSFNSASGTYTFSNICRLLSYCYHEKQEALKTMSEAEWLAQNPDWDKVCLIPVTTTRQQDASGSNVEVSVNHDLDLGTTRLVRGTSSNPLQLQVIYSRFQ